MTVFHQEWWLDIVSGGRCQLIKVEAEGKQTGVLPIFVTRWRGLTVCKMPPFTHVLGPAVDVGVGNSNAKMHRRFNIVTELLRQVPKTHLFRQVIDVGVPETIAFQAAGYRSMPHYTIRVSCADIDLAWAELRQKTRRFIRRSQETYEPTICSDPDKFTTFYISNLLERKRAYRGEFSIFPRLYEACKSHNCGEIYAIETKTHDLIAAIFVVWGSDAMYYLLTTRDRTVNDYGLISLLIWRAMQEAHRLGVSLDLDGIVSREIFHFLSGFGGNIAARTIVQRQSRVLEFGKSVLKLIGRTDELTFF